ncbi:MAG: Spx/MgsR family RNA polymerase-binding regulatory protein [Pseudomonadota bacterium]
MITLYTLKSCDTCKKTLKWLDQNGIEYRNLDVRADGIRTEMLEQIVANLGWEVALNRRSTTWRGLSEPEKADLDNAKAIRLLEANPTLMKRPVIVNGDQITAGFDAGVQQSLTV